MNVREKYVDQTKNLSFQVYFFHLFLVLNRLTKNSLANLYIYFHTTNNPIEPIEIQFSVICLIGIVHHEFFVMFYDMHRYFENFDL